MGYIPLKGDKVKIVKGASASNDIYEVLSDPYNICGAVVVKMKCHETGKYYGGGYGIEYLEVVERGVM